jgi:SM-20-related protein
MKTLERSSVAIAPPPRPATHIKVGPGRRDVFILDDVVPADEVGGLYQFFRNLPYHFADSDRFDTRDYRHFGHVFDDAALMEHPVVGFFAGVAVAHLQSAGANVGRVKRAYVNLNLYGDVQFAHEDGDEWTAVAFVNERWHDDWGGELLVYDRPDRQMAYAITPAPGRMAIFDGLLMHRGGVPSKLTAEPRITLALKMSRRRARRAARA